MLRLRSGLSGVAIACAIPAAGLSQVVLEGGGVTLRAPASLDCAALPVIAVEGAIAAALAGDRAAIGDAVLRMSQGIASACPAAEALEFQGSDREVTIAFRTEKAQGWRMAGTVAGPVAPVATEVAAEAQAKTTAPTGAAATPAPVSTAPQTAAAEPQPEDTPPPIAPGIAFNDLAQFYGGVPTVRGHAVIQPSETWTRVLAARAYAERPDILAEDMVALEIAQQMLSPVEFQQFAGPLSTQMTRGFQNLSVFDRRDLAERVRSQLKPYLDQRRHTGPIDVVHPIPLRLSEYSFERGAFPFQGALSRNHQSPAWRGYGLSQLLDAVALPTELRASVDEARQIDEFLRTRRDPTIYLGVFVTVDPRAPDTVLQQGGRAGGPGRPVSVVQVALFFDKDLTQMLFDFTQALADRQTAVAALQQEFSRRQMTGESLIKAISEVSGDTTAPRKVADAAAFVAEQYQQDPLATRSMAESAMARAQGGQRHRIAASLSVRPYDAGQGGLPVSRVTLAQPTFSNEYLQSSIQMAIFPDLKLLPVGAEVGARITEAANHSGFETVIEGDVVQGNVLLQDNYLQVAATVTPRRILVFSGRQGQPIAERELLADITLPEAPSLPAAPFATFGGGN